MALDPGVKRRDGTKEVEELKEESNELVNISKSR